MAELLFEEAQAIRDLARARIRARANIYARNYTAATLCHHHRMGIIVVPEDLQRRLVWSEDDVALWADSMRVGLSAAAPIIVLRRDEDRGEKYLVVDGRHRLWATCRVLEQPQRWGLPRDLAETAPLTLLVVELDRDDPMAVVTIFARINVTAHPPSIYVIYWAARYVDHRMREAYEATVLRLDKASRLVEPEKAAVYAALGWAHPEYADAERARAEIPRRPPSKVIDEVHGVLLGAARNGLGEAVHAVADVLERAGKTGRVRRVGGWAVAWLAANLRLGRRVGVEDLLRVLGKG